MICWSYDQYREVLFVYVILCLDNQINCIKTLSMTPVEGLHDLYMKDEQFRYDVFSRLSFELLFIIQINTYYPEFATPIKNNNPKELSEYFYFFF